MEQARLWWSGRTIREQRLLGGLAVAVALVLVWYGLVSPLLSWREASIARYARAVTDHATVQAALGAHPGSGAMDAADMEGRIRQAAEARALILTAVEPDGAGGWAVSLDSAPPPELFGWIGALEREDRLAVTEFTAIENPDATLQAQVGFRGARP